MAHSSVDDRSLFIYADILSRVENVMVVVSDLLNGTSRIFPGKLGEDLGIGHYSSENSIWEKAILELMPPEEREKKYFAELRFFHYLKRIPKKRRQDYCLMSRLRFKSMSGDSKEILHTMYYVYSRDLDMLCYAVCQYGMASPGFQGKSLVLDTRSGTSEELTSESDSTILSHRETQVLELINQGKTSLEIALMLSISKNTVSRHRQEILSKLQVRNSLEACRMAKTLGIL